MKKNVFLFKNCIFYRVFGFVLYILLIDVVDSDGLMVFFTVSLTGAEITFSTFTQIFSFDC